MGLSGQTVLSMRFIGVAGGKGHKRFYSTVSCTKQFLMAQFLTDQGANQSPYTGGSPTPAVHPFLILLHDSPKPSTPLALLRAWYRILSRYRTLSWYRNPSFLHSCEV